MLTLEQIRPYLEGGVGISVPNADYLHLYYDQSRTLRTDISEVFSEKYPSYLDINRPRELPEHKEYRKKVYQNPFRGFRSRIVSVLDYIRQADDFDVQFPTYDIAEEESLKTYTGKDFSPEGSVLNWFFTNAVPAYINDPNAVLLVLPERLPLTDNDYPEPRLHLIPSENVWAFRRGKFAVLVSTRKSLIEVGGKLKEEGRIIYFADHESYTIATQITAPRQDGSQPLAQWSVVGLETGLDPDGNTVAYRLNPPRHYCRTLPARKLGLKLLTRNEKDEELYESLISDALPFIRMAQQNQSDIQVETNFHVASQEWRRSTNKCKNPRCVGGVIYNQVVQPGTDVPVLTAAETCPKCQGTGFDTSGSGLGIIWVTGSGQQGFNTPEGGKIPPGAPGGFIPRNIESLQEFVAEFKRNTDEAYCTINMQFIRVAPVAEQSGSSKRYDREELYRELNTQAGHLLDILQYVYVWMDCQRYGTSGRTGQAPQVLVPVRFNLENAELTREELNNAKEKKYDSTLVEALESKMLLYTTGEGSDEYRRYRLRKALDPYKDMSDEMKLFVMGVVLRNPKSEQQKKLLQRLWFSIHFDGLVSDALLDDEGFWDQSLKDQRQRLFEASLELFGDYSSGAELTEPLRLKPSVDIQNVDQIFAA